MTRHRNQFADLAKEVSHSRSREELAEFLYPEVVAGPAGQRLFTFALGERDIQFLKLTSEKRKNWDDLKAGLKRRFPLRVLITDPGLASLTDNLKRRSTASLAAFVERATDLSF